MPLGQSTRWSVIGLLLVGSLAGANTDREQSLAQMDHKKWTSRDGAPAGIRLLAQGTDGTLWLGTDTGLFNFDGRTFAPFQSPAGEPDLPIEPVRSLLVTRDGTLWVGFYDSGIARIAQGRVTLYRNAGETSLRVTRNLREARDGGIWGVATNRRLVRFGADQLWHTEPLPSTDGVRTFGVLDSLDTLWVAQQGRLYRRDIHQPQYVETNVPIDWLFGFAEAPDGTVWFSDFDGAARRSRLQQVDRDGRLIGSAQTGDAPSELIRRPDGALFYGTQNDGLRLLPADMSLASEYFTERDGLSSNKLHALVLTLDGTLWVGTSEGLDRFRAASFTQFTLEPKPGRWSVCANERGETWIAMQTGLLYRFSGGLTQSFSQPDEVKNLFCGRDGNTWLVGAKVIWLARGDRFTELPPIPGMPTDSLGSVVATSERALVVRVTSSEVQGGGLWQYKDDEWTRFTGPGPLSAPGKAAYIDKQDRLWVAGFEEVTQPTLTGGRIFEAPGLGPIYAFLETRRGFYAAGVNGLALLRGSRFEILRFEDRTYAGGVNGLVEALDGDLWINAARGIVRVPASELQAAVDDPRHRVKSEVVTDEDFPGIVMTLQPYSTTARDADGRLWFATRNGVIHIDPQHRRRDARPPTLSIRSVAADRTALGADGTFAPRPQTLEIRYFGVHLLDPNRVRYRYRLVGLEDAWQDAGSRTEAFYTRLAPGAYTFQVTASGGNDAWTAPVSRSFVILPSFYQTTWFRALCIVGGLALIFTLFVLRVRAVTRTIRARAEERADERIRIARELHDTLLQGVQGLLLNFHVAAQKIAPDDASKAMLDRTLATADRIILEGRNRVSNLRSEQVTDAELVASLENTGNDLRARTTVEFKVTRSGIAVPLLPGVSDEIYWIAREALTNAFRHARASQISVDLNYGERYFEMACTDDGCGFDMSKEGKEGHWGLRGMAERARKLGGEMRWRSEVSRGTQITVTLPAYRAYPNHSRLMFYLRALQRSERSV